MQPESISLSFKQGSADKVYNAQLEETPEGWVVNFAYGRRGKPLRTGTKTPKPIAYEAAKKAYDALVNAKMSKGYTSKDDGVPFTASEKAGERTSWLPQLLNAIDDLGLAEAFGSWRGNMYLQIKHDGERRGLIFGEEIVPANRKGLRTTIDSHVYDALRHLRGAVPKDWILDCEDMGDHLVIFDIIDPEQPKPFKDRLPHLATVAEMIFDREIEKLLKVDMPELVRSVEDLRDFVEGCRASNQEGVVIRHGDSVYEPGRPNSGGGALKFKFYESCTCRVQSQHATKRSIGLELLDNGEWTPVGNCTIPPNYDVPEVGQLVEIKYLYAYRGGSIYQPQYKGVRTDLEESAADINQLKFKE